MADELNGNGVIDAEVVETPVETEVVEETPDVIDAEIVDAPEETSEETSEETEVAVPTQEPPEPVTFDTELPVTDIIEKGKVELDKYELPQPIQAYIETLEAKAQVQPLAEFADYGEPEIVKTLLERQSFLTTSRLEDGIPRANTDKFVETLVSVNTPEDDRVGQLIADLLATDSVKYQGRNRLAEVLIDELAQPNDTVSAVTKRFDDVVKAMLTNTIPTTDIPAYIPEHLREAYGKWSRSSREEISNLDLENEFDKALLDDKLRDLEVIQKGIDGERREAIESQRRAQIDAQNFQQEVWNTERAFYSSLRKQVAEELSTKVHFSDDPKLQAAQVARSIALMTQALDDGVPGESARAAFEAMGIQFDHPTAQSLLKGVELAAVNLVKQQRQVGQDGQPLDPPALKKAQNEFTAISKKLTQFGLNLAEQEARFTATGKAEDVKKAAEKIKVPEKARPVVKGTASPTRAPKALEPPAHIKYGTPEWDSWWARQHIQTADARRRQAQGLGMPA